MNLDFVCKGHNDMKPSNWNGHLQLLNDTAPYELEVTARDSCFHIICGIHKYGNYICIPNWGIGTEMAGLGDSFWNQERLTTYYPEISIVDIISIITALSKLNEYVVL